MSAETIISVEGLSKRYQIGRLARHATLRDSLTGLFRDWGSRRRGEDFWALRDVSFEIKRGEVVGIIGRNGAGKSTLLKILSRITEPTQGRVRLRGRVASLLEVGTGFHPELSGRENIYLNGAILGMRRAEIQSKFDDIVAFAEVEQFIDTPVKRYSSGMYVRLAFAVAAHLDPEILIVDEVLAVGDAVFQRKCLGKMDAVARGGRTVLFVSHNMAAVQHLCQSAIWLQKGRFMMKKPAAECITGYLKASTEARGEVEVATANQGFENSDLRFLRVATVAGDGTATAHHTLSEGVGVEIDYEIVRTARGAQVAVELWNEQGVCVLCTSDFDRDPGLLFAEKPKGRRRAQFRIPPDYLRAGAYTLSISSSIPNVKPLAHLDHVLNIEVTDDGSVLLKLSQGRLGIVLPILEWRDTGA